MLSKFSLKYRDKSHKKLPHVVKFSGGRSSGMMLLKILESGAFKRERGDVIVFNNTSAEHPKTYEFVRRFKRHVERNYKIPFFWIEFQTYEDVKKGEYIRYKSFKLVNEEEFSKINPDGYHWKGEVFEEMLSFSGYVPNIFKRICTKNLKLEPTRGFLKEWFSGKSYIQRLGHYGNKSKMSDESVIRQHEKNGGSVPDEVLLEKKKCLMESNTERPSQQYNKFSKCFKPFENKAIKNDNFKTFFGEEGVQYLSFIGLRHDEQKRVERISNCRRHEDKLNYYEGEIIYMPLNEMECSKEDVNAFWKSKKWDLDLDADTPLSNCTFCFLKGGNNLKKIRDAMTKNLEEDFFDTPCDLNWWVKMENTYGRDLIREERERSGSREFIGFFGNHEVFSYEKLYTGESGKSGESIDRYLDKVPACDCTD